MRSVWLLSAGALALGSTLAWAQGQPEDLLPPGFSNPAPAPAPAPTSAPAPSSAPAPQRPNPPAQPSAPPSGSGEVVQPLPTQRAPDVSADLSGLPTIEELEALTTDELDERLGLRPRYDIPPAARRSLERVGVIDSAEGGFPSGSLARQPGALVRAALGGLQGPVVSRWGHILLRRTLASRMEAPSGMNAVEFAARRAQALNAMGEYSVARALVQDVDTQNYSDALTDAAVAAYIGTADVVGACPAVRLADSRTDGEWRLLSGICNAFAGEETRANNDLRRALNTEAVPRIDALLAQRYAGAAGNGRRAVNIEWDDVDALTPWRFALANAVGEPIPEALLEDADAYYRRSAAVTPALPIMQRVGAADTAAAEGILSSAALIDLYAQIYAADGLQGDEAIAASRLREAYVSPQASARLAAIQDVWGVSGDYGRYVLTAFAAARMPASDDFADAAPALIASMLAAGLDRDAMRWERVVAAGSEGWGLLAVARPGNGAAVTDGNLADYLDNAGESKARMLFAGLAGLGRVGAGEVSEYSSRLDVDLGRQSRWTRAISGAADAGNPALVSLLAGLGMQGSSWERMTPLHLYHLVRALSASGLEAEARMIAAEAVARA